MTEESDREFSNRMSEKFGKLVKEGKADSYEKELATYWRKRSEFRENNPQSKYPPPPLEHRLMTSEELRIASLPSDRHWTSPHHRYIDTDPVTSADLSSG